MGSPFPNGNLILEFPPVEAGWRMRAPCSLGIVRIKTICCILPRLQRCLSIMSLGTGFCLCFVHYSFNSCINTPLFFNYSEKLDNLPNSVGFLLAESDDFALLHLAKLGEASPGARSPLSGKDRRERTSSAPPVQAGALTVSLSSKSSPD